MCFAIAFMSLKLSLYSVRILSNVFNSWMNCLYNQYFSAVQVYLTTLYTSLHNMNLSIYIYNYYVYTKASTCNLIIIKVNQDMKAIAKHSKLFFNFLINLNILVIYGLHYPTFAKLSVT
jgi:hypothetical protein